LELRISAVGLYLRLGFPSFFAHFSKAGIVVVEERVVRLVADSQPRPAIVQVSQSHRGSSHNYHVQFGGRLKGVTKVQ
jgi:hypothetical protein